MSVTKDGFYNIEGKMFEVVHGVEGDCLILGDEDGGTRISGPKPWGGGQVTKTFVTQEKYGPIERLEEENAKLRELCKDMMWTIRHAHGYFKDDTHEMLMTYVRGRDGKPTYVAYSLTCDEEKYEKRMEELRIEEER